jgi:hypothetical protein
MEVFTLVGSIETIVTNPCFIIYDSIMNTLKVHTQAMNYEGTYNIYLTATYSDTART